MPDQDLDDVELSIVVPAYNVEAYLRQCLTSVLAQAESPIEVIVVLDAPTDRTAAIAREVASVDDRVRVIDNPANQGLGPSRNNGLAAARGEYVMFLDSDDYVLAGTLEPLLGATRAEKPDIVVYDYERVYWNDRRARNVRGHILADAPEPITLADRPDLLLILNVAWNKLYRRDFLVGTGLQFPPGYYEDIPFTYPILAMASSIQLVDEVVVAYRQRRSGSILRSHDLRHAEVVDQVERALVTMAAHPETAPYANHVFQRCASHVLTVIDGDRLPAAAHRDTFRRASEVLRAHRPQGFELPPGIPGKKLQVLLDDRFRYYGALSRANAVRTNLKRRVAKVRKKYGFARMRAYVRRRVIRGVYLVNSRRRIDPDLTVMYSLWGRVPVGNPWAIAQELERVRPSMRVVWLTDRRYVDAIPEGLETVLLNSVASQRVLARARFLVSDVNFPDSVRRRPGQIMLETQHGTPLKFMGLDMQRFEIPASSMNFGKLMKRVDVWSFNLSSNAYSTEVWRRAFPARYEMLEYGYPRNDRLVTATAADTRAAREALSIPDDHRVILYAPTHRDYRKGFAADLDIERVVAALPPNTTVLVRGHYFYAGSTSHAVHGGQRLIDASEHRFIEDLYLAADVLVTDYSSAMFDFANLGRPIIIHAPDWDRYRTTRGSYFDITAEPPGMVTSTDEELVAALLQESYASAEAAALLGVFRQRFCQFDDGHAAERVVRRVFLGEKVRPPGSIHGDPPPLSTWVTDRAG